MIFLADGHREAVQIRQALDVWRAFLRRDGLTAPAWATAPDVRITVTEGQRGSDSTSGAEGPHDPGHVPFRSLLTIAEVAALELGVSVSTVKRLVRTGELPSVKLANTTRIRRADLDAYVASLPVARRGEVA